MNDALERWLAVKLDLPHVEVAELRRHNEGFSWQTLTCEARWDGGALGLALRIEPRDGLLPPYDAENQYRIHEALEDAPAVPLPKLYWLERGRDVLGMPFYAMERVDGEIPVQWGGGLAPALRDRVGREFVTVQSALHALDWRARLPFLDAPRDADHAAAVQIEHWQARFADSVRVDVPMLRYAFGWLKANVASSGRLALCHGDYRIGNFILRDERIVAVLDWELAHVSDPVEDIAYSGLPLFRGRTDLYSQLLPRDVYLGLYSELSKLTIEPDVLRFWTVLGLAKAATVHVAAARAFEDGRTNDLRLAALGHQAVHVLRMLARELGR